MSRRHTVFTIILVLLLYSLPLSLIPRFLSFEGGSAKEWDFTRIDGMRDFAYVDDDSAELVIGVRGVSPKDYARLMGLITKHEGNVVNRVSFGDELEAVVVDVPLPSVSSFVEETRAAMVSRYIEPNVRFTTHLVPNDPYWNLQWAPAKIEADYAWNITVGNSSVLVAVIDTGIDWDHPDLAANYVQLGYDWVNGDEDPMDDNGHGTRVAGIIAAVLNNNLGVAGLAQVSIMAEKGLDSGGNGDAGDLANAITDAVDRGADILCMSWGSYESSVLIRNAIRYAYRSGALLVASAGNNATNQRMYPAAYDEVIAVTATDQLDNPASFTNYGDWVELAAPGVSIYTTSLNDEYHYLGGTSAAAPHVSGVAALVWSLFPEESRDEVRMRLRSASDDLGDAGFDPYYGYGRINARKALAMQNIAIRDVLLQKTVVGQGFNVEIYVNITNQCNTTQNFNVTAYVNATIIQVRNVTLAAVSSTTLTFTWNTTTYAKGNYTVSAYASPIPNEIDTTDNTYTDGTIIVTVPGDVNADGAVNIYDLVRVARAYGTKIGDPLYDPNRDVDGNGDIDLYDLVIVASYLGETST
jgi:subtilisin family serine protease